MGDWESLRRGEVVEVVELEVEAEVEFEVDRPSSSLIY